jgi:hypothetical protein
MTTPTPHSQFIPSQFIIESGYIHYRLIDTPNSALFIARFKHKPSSAKSFAKFIAKHFHIDEYFSRLAGGEAPLEIARSKGYELPHIIKWRKEGKI